MNVLNVRSVYYLLSAPEKGKPIIPATSNSYKSLSRAITAAKKKGTFPEDTFTDSTRITLANFLTLEKYITPKEHVRRLVNKLRYAHKNYRFPRWFKQPYYVVLWTEKNTMLRIFESIYQNANPPRDVPCSVNRGNSGYQTFTDRCDEILRLMEKVVRDENYSYEEPPKIRILYFGDLDPSGMNMSRYLQDYLKDRKQLWKYDIKLIRVAVTLEQIVKYQLPFAPQDLDTMQKLWADSNIGAFSKRLRTRVNI
jgi:hypothetical protein